MSAPHDNDMCPSNVREELINRLSLEWGSDIAHLRCGHRRPDPIEGWGMAAGGKKWKEKKKKKVPVLSAQEAKDKGKLPKHSAATRSGDAIRVSAKHGESYAEIRKAMMNEEDPTLQERRSSPSEEPGGRRSSSSSKILTHYP